LPAIRVWCRPLNRLGKALYLASRDVRLVRDVGCSL
jgi:hypothetical protein